MTHNWKPGDIALVEAGCWANRVVALRSGVPSNMGWAYCGEDRGITTRCWSSDTSGIVTPIRPLLVIDPEDRAQIEWLADVFCQAPSSGWMDQMQAALRSLLEPEPEEPTGLGAVVRDRQGATFIRVADPTFTWAWRSGISSVEYRWSDLTSPLTVLSPGYVEEGE